MTSSQTWNKYPLTATVKCDGCGIFVEARFDNSKQYNRKVYCMQPCGINSRRRDKPTIIRVYVEAKRVPTDEYTTALRKHKGLEDTNEHSTGDILVDTDSVSRSPW